MDRSPDQEGPPDSRRKPPPPPTPPGLVGPGSGARGLVGTPRPQTASAPRGAKLACNTSEASPSGSGDQATTTTRIPHPGGPIPASNHVQHQPFYPLAPHFQSQQPMFPMSNPPLQPSQFEPLSAASRVNGFFDVQDLLNQQLFEPHQMMDDGSAGIKAVVEKQGYISLRLRYDAHVDIAPNQALRIVNHRKGVTLALSGCATQMAMVHPQGRVLQYNSRIEIQTEDFLSIKNAKMWPRGVSFTANNCALVYLVDQAGARSTTDTFHDLYADNIADTVFLKSCQLAAEHSNQAIAKSVNYLERAEYWRTDSDLDCWLINDVTIKQTPDGLVSVERKHGCEMFTLKTSPSNGKARLQSSFLYLTASMGEESHIFVKSNDRRLHYNGHAFVVRNAGHSAGFDESGLLRIW